MSPPVGVVAGDGGVFKIMRFGCRIVSLFSVVGGWLCFTRVEPNVTSIVSFGMTGLFVVISVAPFIGFESGTIFAVHLFLAL